MTSLDTILAGFEQVDLLQVENAGQQKRSETKFLLPYEALPSFLKLLTPDYSVLTIDSGFVFSYRTQYFDTPAFDTYLAHHNGRMNRYKIRERTYEQTGKTFLEVKFSSNTGKGFKYRIPQKLPGDLSQEPAIQFLSTKTPYDPGVLLPTVTVRYKRISLVNISSGERVTVDMDLAFSNGISEHKISNFAVVEVKQLKKLKSPVLQVLGEIKMKPRPFSKYCLGVNYMYPGLKKNNFKKKLTRLNKLMNDASFNHFAVA